MHLRGAQRRRTVARRTPPPHGSTYSTGEGSEVRCDVEAAGPSVWRGAPHARVVLEPRVGLVHPLAELCTDTGHVTNA